jgi:outer membrane immunogenic protein
MSRRCLIASAVAIARVGMKVETDDVAYPHPQNSLSADSRLPPRKFYDFTKGVPDQKIFMGEARCRNKKRPPRRKTETALKLAGANPIPQNGTRSNSFSLIVCRQGPIGEDRLNCTAFPFTVLYRQQPPGRPYGRFCVFRGSLMKKLLVFSIAALGLIGTPAFAADMAVKAPPVAPAPVLTWTRFYGGIQFGGGWSDEAVNLSPNDPFAAALLSGSFGPNIILPGQQPLPNGIQVPQNGPVGGFEAGYNWQAGPNWVLGLETDFSGSGLSGHASTSILLAGATVFTQTTTAQQSTDWYGTVRGRVGWLATPNLLLFGTGGFAYGRVADSANVAFSGNLAIQFPSGLGFNCLAGSCFPGSSSAIRTGWTAGGGLEWLLDQHWSAKVEYQFVDLGEQTVQLIAQNNAFTVGSFTPSSFSATFHDRFNVVRLGLNYQFH